MSSTNPISRFHEYCQKNKITSLPEERWDFQGPPNDRIWSCHVMWDGIPFSAFGGTKQDIRSRIYHELMNYLCIPKVKKQEEQGGLTMDQLNWLKVHLKSAHFNVKNVIEADETMVCNGLICAVMALRDAMKILGIYKEEEKEDSVGEKRKEGEPEPKVKEINWNREEPEVLTFRNGAGIYGRESEPVTCPDNEPNDPAMARQYIKPEFDLNDNYAIKKTKDNEHWPVFQDAPRVPDPMAVIHMYKPPQINEEAIKANKGWIQIDPTMAVYEEDKQQAELLIDYIIQEFKEEEPITVGYKDTIRMLAVGISKVRVPNQAYPLFSIREVGDIAPYGCETKEQLLSHLMDGTYRRMHNLYKKEKGAIARICIDDDLSTDERRIINEVD